MGNIFFGDDGFGPEVARRIDIGRCCAGARVVDYGIRGTHLAYDLLEGWESLVLIDTIPSRGNPGTIHVLSIEECHGSASAFDPHGMDPASVLGCLERLGGTLPTTVVVGCEPAVLDEMIGLSGPVAAAIPIAAATVERLVGGAPGHHQTVHAEAG